MGIDEKLEALLFASEEPLSLTELSSILLESQDEVKKSLKRLIKSYESRNTSIVISVTGKKYKMTLKSEFNEVVSPVATPELSKEELKALTLIVNSKKAMKGEVNEKLHKRADAVITNLKKLGFIKSEKYRNTEIYKLTGKFYKYFNVKKGVQLDKTKGEEENEL